MTFFFPVAAIALAFLLTAYAIPLAAASVVTAARAEWRLLPLFPPIFACYHFGYGFGFLFGIWDFMVRRRAAGRFVALTRS